MTIYAKYAPERDQMGTPTNNLRDSAKKGEILIQLYMLLFILLKLISILIILPTSKMLTWLCCQKMIYASLHDHVRLV